MQCKCSTSKTRKPSCR